MKALATVVAVNGEQATVETVRLSACEGCHKKAEGEGCSVCSLLGGEQKMQAEAKNACHAEVGDTVQIESETKRLLLYAVLLFLVPVFLCFVCYGIVWQIFGRETISIVGGILGFGIGILIGILISGRKKESDIVITQILMRAGKG